jgi:hypothetical protein
MTHRLQGLRQLAQGKPCCARTRWCNANPETTVWCHLADQWAGRGFAHKSHDLLGFFACSSCHDVIDGRDKILETTREERRAWGHEAVCRTQAYLLDNALITVKVAS